MKFSHYQKEAKKTAIYPKEKALSYLPLGLVGESGEVAEIFKKIIRDEDGKISESRKEELKKEMGDILWYISSLSTELNIDLEEVAKENIEKLSSRKKRNKLSGSGNNR